MKTTAARPPLPPFTCESATQRVHLFRRWLEHPRPRESSSRIRHQFTMEEPLGVHQRTKRNYCLPVPQVGQGVGLAHQGNMGVHGKSHRRTLCLRVARRLGLLYRSYGNENWEFNDDGLMNARFASINDLPIAESDRKYYWAFGRRPDDHPGLSDLGL